jgi:hypothetical protein
MGIQWFVKRTCSRQCLSGLDGGQVVIRTTCPDHGLREDESADIDALELWVIDHAQFV